MMAVRQTESRPMLSELLAGLTSVSSAQEYSVSGLTLDSRQVLPGTLFLACSGSQSHGLAYARQAMAQGACAVVWEPDGNAGERLATDLQDGTHTVIALPQLSRHVSEIAARFYGDPSRELVVYGITGTNGKTSICQLLAQALADELPCATIGTLGYGFPGALQTTGYTTPDAVTLQKLLDDLRSEKAQAVSMEVSSHALDQGRAAAVHFDGAVFTNLSRDHFDYHGSFENYAAAKARLFSMPGLAFAVINQDDEQGEKLLRDLDKSVSALAYTLDADKRLPDGLAGWAKALDVHPSSQGMEIQVSTHRGDGLLKTRLLGRFNVSNLLAVLLVLLQRGWDLTRCLTVMQGLSTVPGRMQLFGVSGQPAVVVDYAHTPDALDKALQAVRVHCDGELSVVFGCGGDRDRGKRPQMGALAERLADRVFVTDDNPRSESSEAIIEEILAGMQRPASVLVRSDRRQAIQQAIQMAKPGDMVLVAGKGHEDYQLVGDQVLHFDDREEVVSALSAWVEAKS